MEPLGVKGAPSQAAFFSAGVCSTMYPSNCGRPLLATNLQPFVLDRAVQRKGNVQVTPNLSRNVALDVTHIFGYKFDIVNKL